MTRKLYAVLVATLVLFATPLAGAAVATDAGNTAGNDSTDDTAGNDTAVNDSDGMSMPFGLQVSSFVDSAKVNETGSLGPFVASFVTQNNPGNAPDHAGPPTWLFGSGDENDTDGNESDTRGPPEDTGPDSNETGGPPADAGPDDDDQRRGPPEHAGPP